jgi:hypothetical protein
MRSRFKKSVCWSDEQASTRPQASDKSKSKSNDGNDISQIKTMACSTSGISTPHSKLNYCVCFSESKSILPKTGYTNNGMFYIGDFYATLMGMAGNITTKKIRSLKMKDSFNNWQLMQEVFKFENFFQFENFLL